MNLIKNKIKRDNLAILILLIAWIPYFYNCWLYSIWDSNEAYYIEGPKEMVSNSESFTPLFNYTYRFEKPILSYWLVILFHKIFGSFLLSERFALAFFALASIILTFLISKSFFKLLDNEDHNTFSTFSALIFATSFKFFTLSHRSIIDILLTFWILLALYFYINFVNSNYKTFIWLYYASIAMALGTLTKGLLGLVVPAGIIFFHLLFARKLFIFKKLHFYVGTVIYLLVAAPWYIYMLYTHGVQYISFFIIGNHLNLYLKGEYSLSRPIWYYIPNLIGGFAPWSLFLFITAYSLYNHYKNNQQKSNLIKFFIVWIAFIFIFFSLSKGKQEEYILQIYPAFSILLSWSFLYTYKCQNNIMLKKLVKLSVFLLSFAYLLVSISFHLLNRTIFPNYIYLSPIPIILIFLSVILICRFPESNIRSIIIYSSIITWLFYFTLIALYLPIYEKEYKYVKYFANYYLNNNGYNSAIGYYKVGIPSLVYYTNEKVYIFMKIEEIKKIAEQKQLYLITDAKSYDEINYLNKKFNIIAKRWQFPTTLKSFIKIAQGLGVEEVYLLKIRMIK